MDKLNFLKSNKQIVRDWYKVSRSYRQHEFKDLIWQKGEKIPFRQDWKILSHMHDLRVWTLAYAPSRFNNVKRLQEIHQLNNEMWYLVSNSLWKRIIALFIFYFLTTKIMKKKYMNQGNFDSHDAQFRDTTAHM